MRCPFALVSYYGIEFFKPLASKKQMIFGVRLDAPLARHFAFPTDHIFLC